MKGIDMEQFFGLEWVLMFIINIILVSLVLWIVGRSTVGGDKAKFSDALWIAVLGIIIGSVIMQFIPIIGFILALILWITLIHRFFDTGWLGAIGIGIVAIIVYAILTFILITLLKLPLTPFWKF
jgi:hypothetical protein